MIKYTILIIIFVYLLIFFAPKKELFFAVEKAIKPFGVVINNEKIDDFGLLVKLKEADIIVKDIKIAHIKTISLLPLIFYNSLNIEPFSLSEDLSDFVPKNIQNINLTYSILHPKKLFVKAKGDFGEAIGDIDVIQRKVKILFNFSGAVMQKYKKLLRNFKKTKEGYVYEYRF